MHSEKQINKWINKQTNTCAHIYALKQNDPAITNEKNTAFESEIAMT